MSDATLMLRVREIIPAGDDAKSFVFETTDGQPFSYQAGQFLTFLIEVHGHEVRRSYSLSTAPAADEFPAIAVKRVPNGEISRFWLHSVKPGDVFQVLPASGRFVLEKLRPEPRDLVLIGAGSGITPLFSLLKESLLTDPDSVITLIYANRNHRTTLFAEEIQHWKSMYPDRLQVVHIHSQPDDEWSGIRGRINNTRLEQLVNQNLHYSAENARFFLCGPYELMRSAEITLHFMGFSSRQIRKESFVIPAGPVSTPESNPHTIRLRYKDQTMPLHVPAHTTILDAALSQGIQLPYSCKGGRCATCAGVCTSGKVRMSVNEVLTDHDLQEGWILTCAAYVDSADVAVTIY